MGEAPSPRALGVGGGALGEAPGPSAVARRRQAGSRLSFADRSG